MKKKIYSRLMIVLPFIVGILAAAEAVRYMSGQKIFINPVLCVLWAVLGTATGTVYLLSIKRRQG